MNNYFSIECVCCFHHALGYLNLALHEIMNNYFSIENARSFLRALGYSNTLCIDLVNSFSFSGLSEKKHTAWNVLSPFQWFSGMIMWEKLTFKSGFRVGFRVRISNQDLESGFRVSQNLESRFRVRIGIMDGYLNLESPYHFTFGLTV